MAVCGEQPITCRSAAPPSSFLLLCLRQLAVGFSVVMLSQIHMENAMHSHARSSRSCENGECCVDAKHEHRALTSAITPPRTAVPACRAKKLFVQVTEIDLRWGVTEEESSSGKAVVLCLEEIDRCNLFLGLVGSRYGWTPDNYDVPSDRKYDWVREYAKGHSITELEIQRAALNKGAKRTSTVKRALFYFRCVKAMSTV